MTASQSHVIFFVQRNHSSGQVSYGMRHQIADVLYITVSKVVAKPGNFKTGIVCGLNTASQVRRVYSSTQDSDTGEVWYLRARNHRGILLEAACGVDEMPAMIRRRVKNRRQKGAAAPLASLEFFGSTSNAVHLVVAR
jgi:hypothetical protein